MACIGNDVTDVTRTLRRLEEFVREPSTKNLTAADRTALRRLLEELEALARTICELEQPEAR